MGVFNTRPRFNNVQIKQLSGDTITLSGTTNISGTFRYLPGATVGYVLKSIDSNGTVGWQPVSVSADTNTFVTGGTLSGNNLILGWNTGGSASPIDLSALSDTTYWTAGTAGTGSIRVTNGGTTDSTGNYAVAQGFNTTASGAYSHSEGRQTTASGDYSHAEGYQSTASGILSHAEGSSIASGTLSHAEGGATVASGSSSHSEGSGTIASGDYSHSEGENTIASGDRSHAEGFETTASGLGSHSEGYQTIASGTYSHAGGQGSIVSGTDSFIHSTNSLINGARSVLLGGQNLTGTTSDTVYVPNLTVREDYILHSDSTLEVTDIPSTFESFIKGSYTEFNWDGITTNLLTNNNPSGSTTFLLGDFSTYPTIKNHGFLSYYGTGYTRTGAPTTGTDFYRNKMVLKIAEDSDGAVFSNASTTSWWWENDGFSRMKLTSGGQLGLGLNTNGVEDPSEMLHVNGGDILVSNTNGIVFTDIQNSAGLNFGVSAITDSQLTRISISETGGNGMSVGQRGFSEVSFPTYGKQGDGFLYSGVDQNGLNIISSSGTGTEDYIRLFAGQTATGTPDLYIQGSGSTRGYVGLNTDSPTNNLDIDNNIGYEGFRVRTAYTPSSSGDTNGEIGTITWDSNYIYVKTSTGWGRAQLDFAF